MLENYHWPGNVRELENVIQRAIILARGNTLRVENLPPNLREEVRASGVEECAPGGSFERQLRDYKVRLAANAVRENNGNKTMAARSLSISRAYLHRLIRLANPGRCAKRMRSRSRRRNPLAHRHPGGRQASARMGSLYSSPSNEHFMIVGTGFSGFSMRSSLSVRSWITSIHSGWLKNIELLLPNCIENRVSDLERRHGCLDARP